MARGSSSSSSASSSASAGSKSSASSSSTPQTTTRTKSLQPKSREAVRVVDYRGGGSTTLRGSAARSRSKRGGGKSKKEIAKERVKKIEEDLGEKLTSQAKEKIKDKVKGGKTSLSTSQAKQILEKEFRPQTTRAELQQRNLSETQRKQQKGLSQATRERAFQTKEQTTKQKLIGAKKLPAVREVDIKTKGGGTSKRLTGKEARKASRTAGQTTSKSRLQQVQDIEQNIQTRAEKRLRQRELSGKVTAAPSTLQERFKAAKSRGDSFVGSALQALQGEIGQARSKIRFEEARGNNPKSKFIRPVLGVASTGLETGQFVESAITEPKETAKQTAKGVKTAGKRAASGKGFSQAGETLRKEPTFALGSVAGEAIIPVVSAKGASKAARGVQKVATKARPDYKPVRDGTIRVQDETGDIRVQEDVTQNVAEQVEQAGKTSRPVSSAQDLFKRQGVLRKKSSEVSVDKPLKNEAQLPQQTKSQLERFQKGEDLSVEEIEKLNKAIREETGSKGLLEKSFFADPKGRARPSRLSTQQKEANLVDILSGDVTTRTGNPQIIRFNKQQVEQFPKELQDVARKIRNNQKLTSREEARLLKFQTQKSGQFKPVGFQTPESEIILAPGEQVVRKGKVGKTIINDRPTEIIQVTPGQVSQTAQRSLNKLRQGKKPSQAGLRRLERETGINYSSSLAQSRPSLSRSSIRGASIASTSSILSSFSGKSRGSSTISAGSASSFPRPVSPGASGFTSFSSASGTSQPRKGGSGGGSGISPIRRPPRTPPKTPRNRRTPRETTQKPATAKIPYGINVKKNDKFRKVAFEENFSAAKKRLRKRLENTPSRKGFITRADKPIPANLGKGFTNLLNKPYVSVEKGNKGKAKREFNPLA